MYGQHAYGTSSGKKTDTGVIARYITLIPYVYGQYAEGISSGKKTGIRVSGFYIFL